MAKKGDPGVLGHVVIFLRARTGMTQVQFGRESRVDQADISRYELGRLVPSEAVLRRMADVAGIGWPLVVSLRQFLSSFLSAAERWNQMPDGQAADLVDPEPARLAAVPYLVEAAITEPARRSAEEERREAVEIWDRLERFLISWRLRLIELSPRCGSWALALQAAEGSLRKAAHKPEEALEMADLALTIADRVPGEESWRSRLMGFCWAHVANARRVANDHAGADEAFVHAWELWRAGTDSEGLLPEWRLFDLEASLRRAERRFAEALELLDRARAGCRGDPLAVGRILLKKERTFNQMADFEAALAVLIEASPFVEASGDCRLLFALRFNMTDDLCHLERLDDAAALLPEVREMAVQQANELDLLRVMWLTAKADAGQGRIEEAVAGLEQVCREFTARELAYDAALAALDLAVLYLKENRTAEVRELAVAMGRIFNMKGIDREALASFSLFCNAARQDIATIELAKRIRAEIEQVRRSALRLESEEAKDGG